MVWCNGGKWGGSSTCDEVPVGLQQQWAGRRYEDEGTLAWWRSASATPASVEAPPENLCEEGHDMM